MMEPMSIMSARPDKAVFEEIAIIKKIEEAAFAEKDWYVTQILGIISKVKYDGFEIVFSGGTCLSKAHKLLQRFSEDIDFCVIASESINTRAGRSKFKEVVVDNLRIAGYFIKKEQVNAHDENRFFSIDVDYESYFKKSLSLRPHIQIEIVIKKPQLMPVICSVSSFLAEISNILPEVPEIMCVQPVENAADKLSAIAWRIPDRIRGSNNDDPSIVRHIHDLAILKDKAINSTDFTKMVLTSMKCDISRPNNSALFAENSVNDIFRNMFDILEKDVEYHREYNRFIKGMSYAITDSLLDYKSAVQSVKEMAQKVIVDS